MATTSELLQQQDKKLFDEINQYIDELKGEAKGDYDFVVKFLKKQFETALGIDDKARADFFSKVANQLEARVGRIPFDYDLKTGREKQDMADYLKQKDAEDANQRIQEKQFKEQQDLAAKQEKEKIQQGANTRGMLGSGIEAKQQQEATQARQTNIIEPQNSTFAYQQALRDEKLRLAQQQSGRTLEDLTTEARRTGEDTQNDYTYGTEKAGRDLATRLAEIERSKKSQMRQGLALQTTATMGGF